eukprot:jgi/Astpho2/1854/fgenesh1_pm.00038_%23_13_t
MSNPLAGQDALFNQYESEYCNKSTEITRKVQAFGGLQGDIRRLRIREVESDVREAEQIIKRMQMEARSFSQDKSQQLLRKVKDYQADLRKISDDFKQAQGGAGGGAAARAELGLSDNYYDTSAGQRERMLKSTEKMDKTTDRIAQGRQQLAETEELGVGVLQNLHRQRETLVHARDTLHGADDGLAKARRVLAGMSRRIMTNKVIMIGICALLIGAIVLVIYANRRK